MARDNLAPASRRVSCAEDSRSSSSSSRSGRGVGTWPKVAALGLAFFAAGAAASDFSARRQGSPAPPMPNKWMILRDKVEIMQDQLESIVAKVQGKDTQIIKEMNSLPPKPLQVFEYGPSRPAWMRNPGKYKYQYVCVVATMGPVEEGIWHKRRAPVLWKWQPPFHVRIVRPNPPGMLDYMIAKGKIKLAKKTVTIRQTDKRTGRAVRQLTRPMTVVERTDGDEMPEHIADMAEAQKEGRVWTDPRPTKGRWGPSNIEEVREEGVMELLAEAGIETPEEIDDITKVIDRETGEKFDMKRAFDFGDTDRGFDRWNTAGYKARREAAKEERRNRDRRQ